MAELVKEDVIKPDNLTDPRTHMVEGKNQFPQVRNCGKDTQG